MVGALKVGMSMKSNLNSGMYNVPCIVYGTFKTIDGKSRIFRPILESSVMEAIKSMGACNVTVKGKILIENSNFHLHIGKATKEGIDYLNNTPPMNRQMKERYWTFFKEEEN